MFWGLHCINDGFQVFFVKYFRQTGFFVCAKFACEVPREGTYLTVVFGTETEEMQVRSLVMLSCLTSSKTPFHQCFVTWRWCKLNPRSCECAPKFCEVCQWEKTLPRRNIWCHKVKKDLFYQSRKCNKPVIFIMRKTHVIYFDVLHLAEECCIYWPLDLFLCIQVHAKFTRKGLSQWCMLKQKSKVKWICSRQWNVICGI